MEKVIDLNYKKNSDWAYVFDEIPVITIKIVPVEHKLWRKRTYSVFADKRLYSDDIYTWSIRYAKHNIESLSDAKIEWLWLYQKLLNEIL